MTICPCCGFKFEGTLIQGCEACGARAVGAALPRPAIELPSYGRSLVLAISGSLAVLVFLVQTILAMFQRGYKSLGFWSWIAAAETAAWRLKWVAIPAFILAFWLGRKLYRSIKNHPERFCGVKHARRGFLASATVPLVIAFLIGITVPARLEQQKMSEDAAILATKNAIDLALYRYQLIHKTLPDVSNLRSELKELPDPDGSIAAALAALENAIYQPSNEVAAVAAPRSSRLRGADIRKASLNNSTDDSTPQGLVFTHYEIRLPGEDKILRTEDDWIVRDGMLKRVSEVAKGGLGQTAGALKP